jgi:penicillin-binding protein 2
MASVPAYDVHDLSASLKDERLPFLNRALAAYPVGSVFKPFVAAAALESGVALPDAYECVGFTDVGELRFRCYRSTAHGSMDLPAAISKSCNCYFIDLGLITGAENVSDTAAQCGFGREIKLTGELIGAAGNVPAAEDLSEGELANLCFGQGALLASPLQLAAAFNTLASGGVYREPTLMRSLVDENKTEYARYKNETEYQALKRNTCDIVNDCLLRNMLEGTGKNGASELFFSCGKTATAQTGRYDENGKESLCTWFCGFFPYEEPKYTVVVFNEDGTSAAEDCAPVFKTISEEIFRQVGW